MAKALNELTATEIVRAIESGDATCEAVVRACLDRIEAREAEVKAWGYLDPNQSLKAAQQWDRNGKRGPLGGVPFGVKDIIDTSDMPTAWGTPIYRDRRPQRDAVCVALTRRAGGILLGKAVTTEFANEQPPKTRNPLDPARTPGGSSSGSAAAVADFMVPLALGTQTTGSTIRPASFCGVFGYRPTYGEHRLHGVMEASGSLDTLGILARSIEDVALYRDVLLGVQPEPVAEDMRPLRIGLCRTHVWDQIEPTTRRLTEEVAERLARAGAKIREVSLPKSFEGLTDAHRWIASFEFARNLTEEIDNHWDQLSETVRNGRIADGLSCSLERHVAAKALAETCRQQMEAVWDDYDLLLTPSAIGEAPLGKDTFAGAFLYKMWTVLHVPALSLPVLKGPNGMPVGIQLFARRHEDRALFARARWVYRRLV